jgi:alkanesulfonate monooxygenase
MSPQIPAELQVFTTCPHADNFEPSEYPTRAAEIASWSDAAGATGMLIYADNRMFDPWLVAQRLLAITERLCPLVAVQPAYMHPYSVAKMVTTLAHLHGRRTYLNIVAGGFKNDLEALGDDTPHDERYERAIEYGEIIKRLAAGGPVSFAGHHYEVSNLRLTPPMPPDCEPRLMLSGSSEAGLAAARTLGAVAVKYPQPVSEEQLTEQAPDAGLRVGIVARPDREQAWRTAHERFPEDRAGQVAHGLAMSVSDSQWHRQLSELAAADARAGDPYWLGPFKNYKTFCPYLVGTYDDVATELARYLRLGFTTVILDIPASEEDLDHTATALNHAVALASAAPR